MGIIGALLVLGIGKVLNHTVLNHDGASVQEVSNSKAVTNLMVKVINTSRFTI